jgi:predicted transcriptional regulator
MDDTIQVSQTNYIDLASDIVSAYVANNSLPIGELPALLRGVHSALAALSPGASAPTAEPVQKLTPAQVKKSISADGLISFEDGKPYKTLRRHLTTRGLTPEAYREKWGLPRDYPMVAASYSEQRSSLAKSLGLGQQRRSAATKAADVTDTVAEVPKAHGGRRKASAAGAPTKPRSRKTAASAAAG